MWLNKRRTLCKNMAFYIFRVTYLAETDAALVSCWVRFPEKDQGREDKCRVTYLAPTQQEVASGTEFEKSDHQQLSGGPK